MPLQETSGNVTTDAYGGGVAAVPNYIEDVFSTYVYTGTTSTQTFNNGIDLSTKGGLVWIKKRTDAYSHYLTDSARGVGNYISSNDTGEQNWAGVSTDSVTSFNTNGFTVGSDTTLGWVNHGNINDKFVSWTWRKQPKFFDIVTFTGNSTNRAISHNLGSVPACIIVKGIDAYGGQNWNVYHKDIGNGNRLLLNTTNGTLSAATTWNNTSPTSTEFTVGTSSQINFSGANYVAYLFASDAGGFGLTGTDNVISCGSFTADGSGNANVTLGYEPQWVLIKCTTSAQGWYLTDTMRGMPVAPATSTAFLLPNTSAAEASWGSVYGVNATGFNTTGLLNSATYIYIAIRRGPMKVPTVGTSVFNPYTATLSAGTVVNVGLTPDLTIGKYLGGTDVPRWVDRLRGYAKATGGAMPELCSDRSDAEVSSTAWTYNWTNTGFTIGNALNGLNSVIYSLRRAPSFFDEVCYTGTGTAGQTFSHNLGVAPELMFVKCRSAANGGLVYNKTITASKYLELFFTGEGAYAVQNDVNGFTGVEPTSSVFTVGSYSNVNGNGSTYAAYLFATCAGVSKVGSYTGNGTTQTIDCGFTTGARFVLIKRTNAVGDWYAYDTARGMTTLTDPYWFFNSNAGEVATLGSVTTVSTGFALNSAILAAINVSGGTYIFLAIA